MDPVGDAFFKKVREDERVQRAEQDIRDICEWSATETLDRLFTYEGMLLVARLSQARLRVALELRKAAKAETARLLAEYPTGTYAGD